MKFKVIKKVLVDLTLDSSEAIMFTKGGRHTVSLTEDQLHGIDKDDDEDDFSGKNQQIFEISVQLQRDDQGRFDFINGEASKHKERVQDENKHS